VRDQGQTRSKNTREAAKERSFQKEAFMFLPAHCHAREEAQISDLGDRCPMLLTVRQVHHGVPKVLLLGKAQKSYFLKSS
jgi:hypothetical protein